VDCDLRRWGLKLAERGGSTARIAGHSNILMAQRNVHLSAAHIGRPLNGRELVGPGDKTSDIRREPQKAPENELPTIAEASMG
jgi:hypothetical protein